MTADEGYYIGDTVKALRDSRGLSQAALAKRAGLSKVYIVQLENRHANPGLVVLVKLADALRVKPGTLLRDVR